MNQSFKKVLEFLLIGTLAYPVVIAILTPYMFWLGLDMKGYINWVITGLPMGIIVNAAVVKWISFIYPILKSKVVKNKVVVGKNG